MVNVCVSLYLPSIKWNMVGKMSRTQNWAVKSGNHLLASESAKRDPAKSWFPSLTATRYLLLCKHLQRP